MSKRTRCSLGVCRNRGAGGDPGQSASETERDGCQMGKESRSQGFRTRSPHPVSLGTSVPWGVLIPSGPPWEVDSSQSSLSPPAPAGLSANYYGTGPPGLSLSSVLGSQHETLPGRQDSRQCPIIALIFNVDFHEPHREGPIIFMDG